MKPFRFPLDMVLEARRAQENEAKQQLALALERHRQAQVAYQEAVGVFNNLLQSIADMTTGLFTVADRERTSVMRKAQERIINQLRAAMHEASKFVEEKRNIAMQARRSRELLERLKDSRRDAWEKESTRLEQIQFDEFAMTRRYQASRQEEALC